MLVWVIAPVAADLLLFSLLRRSTLTAFRGFRARVPWQEEKPITTLNGLMTSWEQDKRDEAAIARRPAIAKVLAAYGEDGADIGRVESHIIRLALGKRVARKVVSDPKLPASHYELEAGGVSEAELVRLYVDRFGGPP